MKANCWIGKKDVRVQNVPDPQILNRRDAIVRITSTAICGSDLHLYNGFIPTMEKGDILGHEFMGEVVEVGREVQEPEGRRPRGRAVPHRLRQRATCCQAGLFSLCENSNPNAWMAEKMWGHSPAGVFGYSHMLGGYRRRPGRVRARAVRRRRARSRSPTGCRTSRCCSSRTSSRPATWARRCATSSPATRSPSGAAARSASSRSRAPTCSAPSASSPSTASPTGCRWPRAGGRRDASTTKRSTSRRAEGDDRRPRPGRLHRRGRAWRRTRPG